MPEFDDIEDIADLVKEDPILLRQYLEQLKKEYIEFDGTNEPSAAVCKLEGLIFQHNGKNFNNLNLKLPSQFFRNQTYLNYQDNKEEFYEHLKIFIDIDTILFFQVSYIIPDNKKLANLRQKNLEVICFPNGVPNPEFSILNEYSKGMNKEAWAQRGNRSNDRKWRPAGQRINQAYNKSEGEKISLEYVTFFVEAVHMISLLIKKGYNYQQIIA